MGDLEPWKVVSSRTVYSSPPYLTVHSHEVELPDGRTVSPYFRIDLRSFVVMAAVTPQNEVVVARQYRHGIGQISLMLPGGLLEPAEDPLLAAQRELLEETGFASDQWEPLGHFVPNSNYRCGETFIFLARNARQIAQPDSGDLEQTELMLISFPQLLQEMENGKVVSLSSAAAILLANTRLTNDE